MRSLEEITVILNGYKRPEYLDEQIKAIKNQSVAPKEIWLWNNNPTECVTSDYARSNLNVIVDSSRNFKYHGRFALAQLASTKYIAIFDDDTIPGSKWFENCLDTLEQKPGSILGGAGVLLNSQQYVYHTRFGWPCPSNLIKRVDLVGHAWFFETNLVKHLWSRTPTMENGEDMQLSFNAWIDAKIETYTPPHPENDKDMWSSTKAWEYGNDSKASSNGSLKPVNEFYLERDKVIEYYLNNGYSPVVLRATQ